MTIQERSTSDRPDRGTVEALKEALWSGRTRRQSDVMGGALYFVAPLDGRYQLRRLELPGLTSEFVSRLPSIFAQPTEGIAIHDGHFHIIFDEMAKREVRPDGRTQLTLQYQWWTVDQDGKNARQINNGLTSLNGIGVSAHYGLIAWTGVGRGGPATLNTVEFPVPTPKKK